MNSTEAQAHAAPAGPPPALPTLRLRKILVPVDFSAPARKALAYALAFARQFQASLVVVHVVELPYVGSGLGEIETPPLEAELRKNAAQQLARLVHEQVADRVLQTTLLRVGQPWHELSEAARELDVDLIIMGTHGYTGLKHVLMGSTAERVVRHAPCPVLVVRECEHEFVQVPAPPTAQPKPPAEAAG
ncbi:MAG: universal stress protein [Verrucomicrobia bacterium]|nr:universal stress protein [Verrucomicrobiota bacterium]